MTWQQTRAGVWTRPDLPSATIYKLRLGGYRFNLGGRDSATYGQFAACERSLLEAAHTLTAFEKVKR